jgi:hypothetical protein
VEQAAQLWAIASTAPEMDFEGLVQ